MDAVLVFVESVKASHCRSVGCGYVTTIVGEGLPWSEIRFLADDLVAFDDQLFAVFRGDDPLAPEQFYAAIRAVCDGDVINEDVRRIGTAVVVL